MAAIPEEKIEAVLDAWLAAYKPATRRVYLAAWRLFVQRCGNDPSHTLKVLYNDPNRITGMLEEWARDTTTKAASITVRLAAINSLIRFLRGKGIKMPKPPKPKKKRDMSGPDREAITELYGLLEEISHTPVGARDFAIFLLMLLHGLRRLEITNTNVTHLDGNQQALWIIGKRRTEREPIALHPSAFTALADWLKHHDNPRPDAPLFYAMTHRGTRSRNGPLTPDAIHARFTKHYAGLVALRLREANGRTAPVVFRPNGFRHAAITLLASEGANIRKFARHKSLGSTQFYLDVPEVHPDKLRECADAIADAYMMKNRKAQNDSGEPPLPENNGETNPPPPPAPVAG